MTDSSPPQAPLDITCLGPASRRAFLREAASLLGCVASLGLTPGLAPDFEVVRRSALRVLRDEAAYPLPPSDGATIDRDHAVILVRHQDRIYAFALWCPHQHTALRWQDEERQFRCPKHKSTFQPDGAFVSGRATRAMDRHPVRRDGETVVVDLAVTLREDEDADRWRQAVVQL
jgi:nitrite reductase/ring-hydroxylating ferredoxin subunit